MAVKTPNTVVVPAVPQLNVPPISYDQQYAMQLNNVLRLYFQGMTNAVQVNVNASGSNTVLSWMNL
jgi:hypothetical protein